MKKNNMFLFAALSIAALASSCQKENELAPSQKNEKISVIVSLGDQTKGFSDAEGVTWEVGDQIKYAGGVNLTSEPLTDAQITNNGHTAAFKFDASLIAADRTGWFYSTKCHPSNDTEVEFTLGADNGNLFTQDVAGEMNKRYLFLHSGTGLVSIKKDVVPTFTMDVAGTILRVLPYTKTYNDEKVLSVKFESKDNVVGTVSYDRGGGSYRSVNDIKWKTYTFVKATLGTAFSLSGVTSAETSKGIYMAIPATKADAPLNGYKYTVETDKAIYTFDAMDKPMAVGNNVVKNVYLNLDREGVRVAAPTGYLKYGGALNLSTVPAAGCTNQDAGYWKAMVSTDGSVYEDRLNAENSAFYSDVQFTYTDPSTGASVDWISVKYGGGDYCHWLVTAQPNTGEERSVKITATYSDVKGYVIQKESKTKELTITQRSASAKKVVEYASVSLPAAKEFESAAQTNVNVGYCLLKIDGDEKRDWADANSVYARSHFAYVSEANYAAKNYTSDVDWLSCVYANDGTKITDCVWLVSADKNTGAERVAYVVCVFPKDEGYSFPEPRALKITQKAGYAIEATLTDVYAETVPAAGATINAATLALTVNGVGVAQADVAAALSTYGITVTADKGATASVAADGTVTLTVPENKYKNGGITYTLSVKSSSGTLLASATFTQAEGSAESTGNVYSYTISEASHADGGVIGFPAPFDDKGVYFRFKEVKVNGETVELTDEIVNSIIASAFVPSDDRPATGYDSYTYASAGQIFIKAKVINNSEITFAPCTTADSKGYCCTINLMNSDGTKNRSIFYFVP